MQKCDVIATAANVRGKDIELPVSMPLNHFSSNK